MKGFSNGFLGPGRLPNIRPKKSWIRKLLAWIVRGAEKQPPCCGNCKTHYNRWRRK